MPDSDGDVGPNHYVESINRSIVIFDKKGNHLSGPISYDSFFAALPPDNPCTFNNQGDPFTLYDPIADRWLISDLAFDGFPGNSFWECIGVYKHARSCQRRLDRCTHYRWILPTQITSAITQSLRCGTLAGAQRKTPIS